MSEHLTYKDAAQLLDKTPQRIGQLVKSGYLDAGPRTGGKTVTRQSLKRYRGAKTQDAAAKVLFGDGAALYSVILDGDTLQALATLGYTTPAQIQAFAMLAIGNEIGREIKRVMADDQE